LCMLNCGPLSLYPPSLAPRKPFSTISIREHSFTTSRPFSLASLASDFDAVFGGRTPTLPVILATISAVSHRPAENHVFATVMREQVLAGDAAGAREQEVALVKLYLEVVKWMLQRDVLVRLHLRIRVVVPPALKVRVRAERDRRAAQADRRAKKGGRRDSKTEADSGSALDSAEEAGSEIFFPFSPRSARMRTRRLSSVSESTRQLERMGVAEKEAFDAEEEDDDDWDEDTLAESTLDDERTTLISNPIQATRLERRWLAAMSEGKDPELIARFNQWVSVCPRALRLC
jgi:hypothetical protein